MSLRRTVNSAWAPLHSAFPAAITHCRPQLAAYTVIFPDCSSLSSSNQIAQSSSPVPLDYPGVCAFLQFHKISSSLSDLSYNNSNYCLELCTNSHGDRGHISRHTPSAPLAGCSAQSMDLRNTGSCVHDTWYIRLVHRGTKPATGGRTMVRNRYLIL